MFAVCLGWAWFEKLIAAGRVSTSTPSVLINTAAEECCSSVEVGASPSKRALKNR